MTDNLQIKVDKAIKLLRSTCGDREVELSYSGGKDSDVILELAKMAGINYRAIYKNTTIDPPGTIRHVRENNVEIVRPKDTFLQLIERKGFPTRRVRFCCQVLKEYKIMEIANQKWKLQRQYLKEYPLQVNDKCVDYNGEVCWISNVRFFSPSSTVMYFSVNYPTKNGERSQVDRNVFTGLTKIQEDK